MTFFLTLVRLNIVAASTLCACAAVNRQQHASKRELWLTAIVTFFLWPAAMIMLAFEYLLDHD